jgi:hypothetical protein
MQEVYRLYYLAVELRPELPDSRLMALLPPKIRDLIESGTRDGLGAGMANYGTLQATYMEGANGVEATDSEFRGLLTAMLDSEVSRREDLPLTTRMKYRSRLASYYTQNKSVIATKRVKFNEKSDPLLRFPTGFLPIDTVLGGRGITAGVITLIAVPGSGKTYLSQAIANLHNGAVWMFDAETGEGLVMDRQKDIDGVNLDNKEYIFGSYNVEDIYEDARANPDPERLIILDSLHFVCGDGRTPESGARYSAAYKWAIEMAHAGYCKYVLITTQVKRGSDGNSIDSAAASATIERDSSALINLTKLHPLPDGTVKMRLFCNKNRMGLAGAITYFAFRYEKGKAEYVIESDDSAESTGFGVDQ